MYICDTLAECQLVQNVSNVYNVYSTCCTKPVGGVPGLAARGGTSHVQYGNMHRSASVLTGSIESNQRSVLDVPEWYGRYGAEAGVK